MRFSLHSSKKVDVYQTFMASLTIINGAITLGLFNEHDYKHLRDYLSRQQIQMTTSGQCSTETQSAHYHYFVSKTTSVSLQYILSHIGVRFPITQLTWKRQLVVSWILKMRKREKSRKKEAVFDVQASMLIMRKWSDAYLLNSKTLSQHCMELKL